MELEEVKLIMKAFLIQASKSIDSVEMNVKEDTTNFVDVQTKKIVRNDGKIFYGVNFLFVTDKESERDKLAKLLNEMFKEDGGFLEIGGKATLYGVR